MTIITKKEVEHIAKLARLELTEKEIEKMQKDLSEVLDYFNSLKKVDSKMASRMAVAGLTDGLLKKGKIMRKDEAKPQSDEIPRKLIEVSPDKKENHIKVNPVRNDWG